MNMEKPIELKASLKPIVMTTRFALGEVVRHAQLGARGVVVEIDPSFSAGNEAFEQLPKPSPSKDQPWYQVLVDESNLVTYVAEDQLLSDKSRLPIEHPLLKVFFEDFQDGKYHRHLH